MDTTKQTQGWHIASWGVWGWLETLLKLIAIGAGIAAFVGSTSAGSFVLGNNPYLAAIIVFTLLTLVSLVMVVVRIPAREIVSMIFAVVNALGHLGLLIALLKMYDTPMLLEVPVSAQLPIIFGGFYIAGLLVKFQFLRISGYSEGSRSNRMLFQLTAGQTVLYILFMIFMLF